MNSPADPQVFDHPQLFGVDQAQLEQTSRFFQHVFGNSSAESEPSPLPNSTLNSSASLKEAVP